MASGTPDWSALASENERFLADHGASAERLLAEPAHPGLAAGPGRPRARGRPRAPG